jgi:hypothetical protein
LGDDDRRRFMRYLAAVYLVGTEIAIPVLVYLRLLSQGLPRQVALAWAVGAGLFLVASDLIALRLLRHVLRTLKARQQSASQDQATGRVDPPSQQDIRHREVILRRYWWIMMAALLGFEVFMATVAFVLFLRFGRLPAAIAGAVVALVFAPTLVRV